MLLSASLEAAGQVGTGVSEPIVGSSLCPDFLVYGHGLYRVDSSTGHVAEWLPPEVQVNAAVRMPDRGGGAASIFVHIGTHVDRLSIDTGQAVNSMGLNHPRVVAGSVLRVSRAIDLMTIEQRHTEPGKWLVGHSSPHGLFLEDGGPTPVTTRVSMAFDHAIDGLLYNYELWRGGLGQCFAFALRGTGAAPYIGNEKVELPVLPSKLLGAGDRVVDVTMPCQRPLAYALVARAEGPVSVCRCDITPAPDSANVHPEVQQATWSEDRDVVGLQPEHALSNGRDRCLALWNSTTLDLSWRTAEGKVQQRRVVTGPISLGPGSVAFASTKGCGKDNGFGIPEDALEDRVLVLVGEVTSNTASRGTSVLVVDSDSGAVLGEFDVPDGVSGIEALHVQD
jgi:hypothetical protein